MVSIQGLLPDDRAELVRVLRPGEPVPAGQADWDTMLLRVVVPTLPLVGATDSPIYRALQWYTDWLCQRGFPQLSGAERQFVRRMGLARWSTLTDSDRSHFMRRLETGSATAEDVADVRNLICNERSARLLTTLSVPDGPYCRWQDFAAMLHPLHTARPLETMSAHHRSHLVAGTCDKMPNERTADENRFLQNAGATCSPVATIPPPTPRTVGASTGLRNAAGIARALWPRATDAPRNQEDWDALLRDLTLPAWTPATAEQEPFVSLTEYRRELCALPPTDLSEAELRFLKRTDGCAWGDIPLVERDRYVQGLRSGTLSRAEGQWVRTMACRDSGVRTDVLTLTPEGANCRPEDLSPVGLQRVLAGAVGDSLVQNISLLSDLTDRQGSGIHEPRLVPKAGEGAHRAGSTGPDESAVATQVPGGGGGIRSTGYQHELVDCGGIRPGHCGGHHPARGRHVLTDECRFVF